MNIAFYVDSIAEGEQSKQIFNCLNNAVKEHKVSDASIFYNTPSPNLNTAKFGFFNSTELWAYTGLLINTTVQNAVYSLNVVNKFKPVYLFKKERDIMGLIHLTSRMPIFVASAEDEQEVYRLTGKKPKLVSLDAESLIEAANE